MDFEKFSERSRGFVQSAQGLATRRGHQRLAPEHLLKVLFDDKEGLVANLVAGAGGNAERVQAAVEAELHTMPRVGGSGAGHPLLAPASALLVARRQRP